MSSLSMLAAMPASGVTKLYWVSSTSASQTLPRYDHFDQSCRIVAGGHGHLVGAQIAVNELERAGVLKVVGMAEVVTRIRRMTRQFDVMLRRIRHTNPQLNLSRAEPSWRT
jgi:hypothetical protein